MTPPLNDHDKEQPLGGIEAKDSSERNSAAWSVTPYPGCRPVAMLGEECPQSEALRCARIIWPEATVE